ncbi:MAG: hypothetical protein ABJB16_00485 [Saprospiraceae bacterium]
MSIDNPGQSNPLRSVTAGKYVRSLTNENFSGEPYHFPLSKLMKKDVNPIGSDNWNEQIKYGFDRLMAGTGRPELIRAGNISKLN